MMLQLKLNIKTPTGTVFSLGHHPPRRREGDVPAKQTYVDFYI
jgi:hypothetical protein